MSSSLPSQKSGVRAASCIYSVKEISVNYEGQTEELIIRPPDLSSQGMFFQTDRKFPEGAVLNLRFRLAISGIEIRARGEVRYCLPGVGVGVQFIGMSPEAIRDIECEVELCRRSRQRRKPHRAK